MYSSICIIDSYDGHFVFVRQTPTAAVEEQTLSPSQMAFCKLSLTSVLVIYLICIIVSGLSSSSQVHENEIDVNSSIPSIVRKTSEHISKYTAIQEITSPTPAFGKAYRLRIFNGDYMRNAISFTLFEILPQTDKLCKLYRVENYKNTTKECEFTISVFKQIDLELSPWAHYTWLLYPASV